MELRALIEAFKLLPREGRVEIFSDSQISVNTITTWAADWERAGWRRRRGEIKNLDLVQEVFALYKQHPNCTVTWTPGHSGNRWNEYADGLATRWMTHPEENQAQRATGGSWLVGIAAVLLVFNALK